MDSIFNILQKHRLETYYNKFLQLGVKDERDFIDSVTDEDLNNLGFSQVERNRFSEMQNYIRRLRAPTTRAAQPVQKSLQSFSLQYTYPKCPEAKHITDMDPEQNTVEDLMMRICFSENIDSSKGVCLYTVDGMPLTDDPFFNTWSLQDRHIKNGNEIYAIFTPKENLHTLPPNTIRPVIETYGEETVRCHVMLKGDFELTVNLARDTIANVKNKLANESGIPAPVLHYRGEGGSGDTLESCGISEESTLHFSLSSFAEEVPNTEEFFSYDVVPSVQQSYKGISKHRAAVHEHKNLIGYIRKLTGCNPLAQSLYQLLLKNQFLSKIQKIAVVEGLYSLFRELLPKLGSTRGGKTIEDDDVFENSIHCWADLMAQAKKEIEDHEHYAPVSLMSEDNKRLCDPVSLPGIPGILEKAHVLRKIKDGEKIPNCTETVLRETSLKRDASTEKILLSIHPSITTYYLWISHSSVTAQNFHINTEKTLGSMAEELKAFPLLRVTPPLLLKDLGLQDPRLVFLNEGNLGIYLQKNKATPAMIDVYDCLSGKTKQVDVDVLARQSGDHRDDQSFVTTRTPKEAIMVLIDTSTSMSAKCYKGVEIQKIHAVKQLFDNFATRSMAYDFHHIIGLVKFDSTVKTLHTFTVTLEKFKEYLQTLEVSRGTSLYDALQHAVLELEKVKGQFPECKLRILCLTDGNDYGSSNKPAAVAVNLIKSDIIVDSILLGKVGNNFLHGISNATGGCCFKPMTSKDGVKLFEIETVLSLEMRKPKSKADPSSITESFLAGLFAVHGYDEFPEAALPSQINSKVTVTHCALKKRILEAKDGRLMEKDKRILEELKSLHCDPHPFFSVFPTETDLTFWKVLMEGPPDTPYEKGVFQLFCQFGPDYPVKPPLVRFITRMYHCNINSVGRICHNIFDRNYNAQVTMRDIFDAVYGLLIIPEPEDPLDSILAEEFLTSRETYDEEAKKHTEKTAEQSLDDMEKKLVGAEKQFPTHLICPLTKKLFVDPVKTRHGRVYEQKAIEKHLKTCNYDPVAGKDTLLSIGDLIADRDMKKMAKDYRRSQIQETRL